MRIHQPLQEMVFLWANGIITKENRDSLSYYDYYRNCDTANDEERNLMKKTNLKCDAIGCNLEASKYDQRNHRFKCFAHALKGDHILNMEKWK